MADLENGRFCYYIPPDQTPHPQHGYRVAIVNANEDGYHWTGDAPEGGLKQPWYWGKTLAEAELVCAQQNKDKLGLDKVAVAKLVLESMNRGHRGR